MTSASQPAQEDRPPYPPFTYETAAKKVKAAQDAWNTKYVISHSLRQATYPRISRTPAQVKLAYTHDSVWRNRSTFLQGRDEIGEFLTNKWAHEHGYRLRKELFAFTENKVLPLRHH
jgi:hypothetical protein